MSIDECKCFAALNFLMWLNSHFTVLCRKKLDCCHVGTFCQHVSFFSLMAIHLIVFLCVFFYSSCWVPSSPPDNNNFLSSPRRNARVQTQWSQPAMLTRGIVMTTGTNDTPLNEPPGADNMPNRWRDLCREPIPPAIWCHVIVSADQRLIATLKLCAALIGTFFFVFCFF